MIHRTTENTLLYHGLTTYPTGICTPLDLRTSASSVAVCPTNTAAPCSRLKLSCFFASRECGVKYQHCN